MSLLTYLDADEFNAYDSNWQEVTKESYRVQWADLEDAQRRDIMEAVACAVVMVFLAVILISGTLTALILIFPVGMMLLPVTILEMTAAGCFVKDAVDTVRKHMYPKSIEGYEIIE